MEELAINGGLSVREEPWDLSFPIDDEEKEAVLEVIESGWLSRFRGGDRVREFENAFANYCGSKYAIATSSGTTALHTAVSAADIGPGDEVLVPALTFVSTASVVLQQNAIPVFVDINERDLTMDLSDLEKKITEKTKAIIPVHLFGHPADMQRIVEMGENYSLMIIEDAAQAHGAEILGKRIGSFGDFGCFSFFQTKNMTCGEGGMVLTNSPKLYEEARLSREHGSPETEKGWYFYDRLGYNYNMTEIQGAIGTVQLRKLDWMNSRRKENADKYREGLEETGLQFVKDRQGVKNVYHNFPILLPEKMRIKRDDFVKAVREEGVPIDVCYPSTVYETQLFQNKGVYSKGCPFSCEHSLDIEYSNTPCKNAESVSRRIMNVFTDPLLEEELLEDIVNSIKKVYNYYR